MTMLSNIKYNMYSSSSKMSLISLPLEILQKIADIVETQHRPSLFALSLTHISCHQAALHIVFRQLQIAVSHPDALVKDIANLIEALKRTNSARHVQCITIKGDIRVKAQKGSGCFLAANEPDPPEYIEEILDNNTSSDLRSFVIYDEPVIVKSSNEDMAWAPVVSLLKAIPCPRDLIYDCQSQFPPSLLEVLHQQHPKCRLHHLTFRFRTLLWGNPYLYEMELATSPSLHRLHVICAWRDSDGDDDFNLEAVMDLASGLAPDLKELSIVEVWPIGCWRYDRRRRESWQGLPGLASKVGGSLTSWSWTGCIDSVRLNIRKIWREYMDLSHLQHLIIGRSHGTNLGLSVDDMEWISRNRSFPQLKTLSVALTRDDFFVDKPDYTENAVCFFETLRSLEELSIYGPVDAQIMHTILTRHGETLGKLPIHPDELWFLDVNGRSASNPPMKFTEDQLSQIAALYPILEELSVPIKRNESRTSEAALYRCFGRMKNLQYLFLILDCSNWVVCSGNRQEHSRESHPSQEDQEYVIAYGSGSISLTRGEVKRTLINCAVDEFLARSIWDTTNRNKEGRQLERLKLWPTGTLSYPKRAQFFNMLVEEMSRSWLLERNSRDDQVDPTVRELGRVSREYRQARKGLNDEFEGSVEGLFRSIWPCKIASKNWRDDWFSYLLEA